jgi:hypothetical protein
MQNVIRFWHNGPQPSQLTAQTRPVGLFLVGQNGPLINLLIGNYVTGGEADALQHIHLFG